MVKRYHLHPNHTNVEVQYCGLDCSVWGVLNGDGSFEVWAVNVGDGSLDIVSLVEDDEEFNRLVEEASRE